MSDQAIAERPWNWCASCGIDVQDDMRTGEFRDGSEGACFGCGTVYTAVAWEDGSWSLLPPEHFDSDAGTADSVL